MTPMPSASRHSQSAPTRRRNQTKHTNSSGASTEHPFVRGIQHRSASKMCDDIQATLAELQDKGAEVTRDVTDQGWGY
jgi:uncharacterized glyoxalase superfamily protein PhnB